MAPRKASRLPTSRQRATSKAPRRISEIPKPHLAHLSAGACETRTLVEALAIDFRMLIRAVVPALRREPLAELDSTIPYTRRMSAAGAILLERIGLAAATKLRDHPSDTVRGWVAYVVAAAPRLSLADRLKRVRPLADDRHFGVREWAWLALRPHICANIAETIRLLTPWTAHRSANLRRFASEATRPRGVWCNHIDSLKREPATGLAILEPLRSDSARYVQDSVANWLNDAARTRPDWVQKVCVRWLRESDTPETRRTCARARRNIRD